MKKIRLEDKDENAYLEVYASDKVGDFVRRALLVIPSGGYVQVSAHERAS